MIVTKLLGGLGNQMFQYAAGLALARQHQVELKLDLTALRRYDKHQGYQFDRIFEGEFPIASGKDLVGLLGFLRARRVARRSVAVSPDFEFAAERPVARQPTHNYWSQFKELPSSCYLSGYWQSPKYFENVTPDVRSAFRFRTPLSGRNPEVAERMRSSNSVSMHIRRGDYVADSETNRFHGVCDWDYYEEAMSIIRASHPEARFFAFSDAPDVVQERFQGDPAVEVVDQNRGVDSYRDMQLMTNCHHHIIANSSFSWWGAWLGQRAESMVIAPSVWFAGSEEPVVDIYDPNWVRI